MLVYLFGDTWVTVFLGFQKSQAFDIIRVNKLNRRVRVPSASFYLIGIKTLTKLFLLLVTDW